MNMQFSFLDLNAREPVPASPLLLVEKVHITFEQWSHREIRRGEEAGNVSRFVYLNQCWKDEVLWKEWCDACEETNK